MNAGASTWSLATRERELKPSGRRAFPPELVSLATRERELKHLPLFELAESYLSLATRERELKPRDVLHSA